MGTDRFNILLRSIIIVLTMLIIVLFRIQIIDHENLRSKADRQNSIVIASNPIRGDILDRNGISFTTVKDEINIKIFPKILGNIEDTIELVKGLTNKDIAELQGEIDYDLEEIEISVSNPDHLLLEEIIQGAYPGTYVYSNSIRYSKDSIARHIVGYIQKDGRPMMGIEKDFHAFLDADDENFIYAFKDVNDKPVAGSGYRYEKSDSTYHDVQLTLDYHIQNSLERILDNSGGRNGAIVVDIEKGEILAAASRPNYKQYDISGSVEPDCLWAIPFRAFPAGSIFKTIVAAEALEQRLYSRDDIFDCHGGIDINGVFYPCHKETGGLGRLTLEEAFAQSCNDTFITIAQDLGGDSIVRLAKEFGFGKQVDIGFNNDRGNLSDRAVYAGAGIGNLALGQGDIMVTPLQAVDMITTIANDGVRKPLKLVKQLIGSDGSIMKLEDSTEEYRVLREEVARELRVWLIRAAQHGTGKRAYDEKFGGSGGKTGTPQVTSDPNAKHYGWFVGFFPADTPKYAIAVLSREDGVGGTTAAPIFNDIAQAIWDYRSHLKQIGQDE